MAVPTPHISAVMGDFAKTVLMPGDPLRAKYIAETYLENPRLITSVRNMLGYTGTYKGKEILNNFSEYLPKFKKIIPHDYEKMMKAIVEMEEKGLSAEQAQIEAFYANKK